MVTRMSGRRPGCPAMTRVFSEITLLLPSMFWSNSRRALWALGSVCRGILRAHVFLLMGSNIWQAASCGGLVSP